MPSRSERPVTVRPMLPEDIPGVVALQRRAFPGIPPWTARELAHHLRVFPEGQVVAVDEGGHIVGSASSLIIDWDDYDEGASWEEITGNGRFGTHDPAGLTLYGADIGVDPTARQKGIGSLLYEARKQIVRDHGLKRLLTGGRIPGYHKVSSRLSAKEYVGEVVAGKRKDPTLSFQLRNGFVVLDVIKGYLDEDEESCGYATLLEWLNPGYLSAVMLASTEWEDEDEEDEEEALAANEAPPGERPKHVRIAAVQYMFRPIANFAEFATQVEFFVRGAKDYGSHFVLFPEYFTMQLLSYVHEPDTAKAVRRLAALRPDYERLFKRLARQHQIYIIGGTHPIEDDGEIFNTAHLFTPRGRVFQQRKVHLTRFEKGPYQVSRGHEFRIFETDFGKIAILVCYDVEFPEAARIMSEAGAEILFVPSCTDDRAGFCRVRYCSQARAIENQIYVAVTGTVGVLPHVQHMAANYGQAAILTPSDYFFARDGIAAEGVVNQEQIVVADVDLELLDERRVNGTVIPLNDQIKDAYDHVVVYRDEPEPAPRQVRPRATAR